MLRIFSIFLLIFSLMAGCTEATTYEDDDVAAIVRGEEITVGDIRFFAEVEDDELPEVVEAWVKETLMIQEAKDMGIDVSDDVEQLMETYGRYPSEDIDTEIANDIREFAESQAKKFDMEPKEFHKEFTRRSAKRSSYLNAYFNERLGHHRPETQEEHEEMNEDAQKIISDLMKKYEDDIEILIK